MMTFNTAMPGYGNDEPPSPVEKAGLIADAILALDLDVVVLTEVNLEDARQEFVDRLRCRFPSFVRKTDGVRPNDSGLMLFSRFPFAPLDGDFPPPSLPIGIPLEDRYEAENDGRPFAVAWRSFPDEAANGSETLMNKGVAFVRIEQPCSAHGSIVVGFTHMQSDNDPEDDGYTYGEDMRDRNQQLAIIRELYEKAVAPANRPVEPAFILGDFNIDGAQRGVNAVSTDDRAVYLTETEPENQPGQPWMEGPLPFNEWEFAFGSPRHFDPGTSQLDIATEFDTTERFFACPGQRATSEPCSYDGSSGTAFIDSWAGETSERDAGQTNSGADTGGALVFGSANDGQRIDYVMHTRPLDSQNEPTICLQHIRRGFPGPGQQALSDHLPLIADFNAPAPRCSVRPRKPGDPRLAAGDDASALGPEPVVFPSRTQHDVVFGGASTAIVHPGSVQWYVVDTDPNQSLAFTVETSAVAGPNRVAFEVYDARDLSRRLPPDLGSCEVDPEAASCRYVVEDGTYYVKVFGAFASDPDRPDREFTGLYELAFRRTDCASVEEACPIGAQSTAGPAEWTDRTVHGVANTRMHFSFATKHTRSATAPTIHLDLFLGTGVDPSGFLSDVTIESLDGRILQRLVPEFEPAGDDAPPEATFVAHLAPDAKLLPGHGTGPGFEQHFILALSRDASRQDESASQFVRFRTDMTYLRPMALECLVERTDAGDDDLIGEFSVDGSIVSDYLGDVDGDLSTWDDGSVMYEHGTMPRPRSPWPAAFDLEFAGGHRLEAVLWEDVLDGINDRYRLATYPVDQQINGLPIDSPPSSAQIDRLEWRDKRRVDDASYAYMMRFARSHRPMPARTAEDCSPGQSLRTAAGVPFCGCDPGSCEIDQRGDATGLVCTPSGRCGRP